MTEDLEMWTVYDHPSDFPYCFVARKHTLLRGATEEFVTGETYEEVEEKVRAKSHYFLDFFPRKEYDDPVILCTWI